MSDEVDSETMQEALLDAAAEASGPAITLQMLGNWAGIRNYEGPADTLYVNFSYRDVPEGRFSQVKVYDALPGPILYLNCPRFTWYREGVPGFGGPEETAQAIRAIAQERRMSRIVCMGLSMGAFGALLHGGLAEADQIIAFSGEAVLNYPFSRSVSQLQRTTSDFDNALKHLKRRNPATTHVVVGEVEIADMLQATLLERIATIHMIPGCSHGTVAFLQRKGLLQAVVSELARDGASPTLASVEGVFPQGWGLGSRRTLDVVESYRRLLALLPDPKIAKRVELAERSVKRNRVLPDPERVQKRAEKNMEGRKARVEKKGERRGKDRDKARVRKRDRLAAAEQP